MEKKKKKEKEVSVTKLPSTHNEKRKGKEKVTKAPSKVAESKKRTVNEIPAKAKGKEKVADASPQNKEGKGRRRAFPDLMIEVGFFPEEAPVPPYITEIIDHIGWRNFCSSTSWIQPDVVRNFYNGRIDEKEDLVVVDETEVPFNAREINAIYQLRDNPNAKGSKIIESTPTELMENAIRVLAKPGVKWDVSPTGIKTLSASSLRPKANLWVYLVKKRLIPTTHDKTVSRD